MQTYHSAERLPKEIRLRDMGSFYAGGQKIEISGRDIIEINVNEKCDRRIIVDPNGSYQMGQMYVQYYIPEKIHGKYPLLLWHGGGMTGKSYETTPDGRPGWLSYFIRSGWKTYLSDAVERGRSSWCPYGEAFETMPTLFPETYVFERFRLGKSFEEKSLFEGSRFPMNGFEEYAKEFVPRWTTTSELTVDAYCALLEKTGPSVIVAHSQGASLAFEVLQKKPDLVKALIAVEPYGAGNKELVQTITKIPILWIFGDYTDWHPAWKTARETAVNFCDFFCANGGDGEVLILPELGIKGNSHMMMMEYNNYEIADLIEEWLIRHGLTAEP